MTDEYSLANNPGWKAGDFLRQAFDAGKPMGSWTGLDPLVGAPLSGALWGAGIGGLYGGIRRFTDKGKRRRPLLKDILTGAGVGAAAGAGSGVIQKLANDRSEVERIVRKDPFMSQAEKSRILSALTGADFMQLQRLAALAAAGALTAAAASRILGLGAIGAALAGGAGMLLANNYFRPATIFV